MLVVDDDWVRVLYFHEIILHPGLIIPGGWGLQGTVSTLIFAILLKLQSFYTSHDTRSGHRSTHH